MTDRCSGVAIRDTVSSTSGVRRCRGNAYREAAWSGSWGTRTRGECVMTDKPKETRKRALKYSVELRVRIEAPTSRRLKREAKKHGMGHSDLVRIKLARKL